MADITKIPELGIGQWQTPSGGVPKLAQAVSATSTDLSFSAPLLDEDGNAFTQDVLIAVVRGSDGYPENVLIPAGQLAATGLSASNVVRGVDLAGLDFSTGNADLAVAHKSGDKVYVVTASILFNALYEFAKGNIASGGNTLVIGDETDTTITLQHKDATGLAPFIRRNIASGEVEFSDDRGGSWTAINDVTASNLLQISVADTTPSYLNTKLAVGGTITKQILNPGANEQLEIVTPDGVTSSAGAGDSGKIPLLNVDGELDISIKGGASQAEAEAGADNTKTMTPLRVKQAIDEQVPSFFVNKIGTDSFSVNANGQTKVIAHNLGRIPSLIRLTGGNASIDSYNDCTYMYNGTTHASVYHIGQSGSSSAFTESETGTSFICGDEFTANIAWTAQVTSVTSTTFTLTSANFTAAGLRSAVFLWDVQ